MAAPLDTGLTVDDLERYEADDGRRVELIDGALYVSPMASLPGLDVAVDDVLRGYPDPPA